MLSPPSHLEAGWAECTTVFPLPVFSEGGEDCCCSVSYSQTLPPQNSLWETVSGHHNPKSRRREREGGENPASKQSSDSSLPEAMSTGPNGPRQCLLGGTVGETNPLPVCQLALLTAFLPFSYFLPGPTRNQNSSRPPRWLQIPATPRDSPVPSLELLVSEAKNCRQVWEVSHPCKLGTRPEIRCRSQAACVKGVPQPKQI